MPYDRLAELEARGALHVFSKPIRIKENLDNKGLLVIAINESSAHKSFFSLDMGRHGGLLKRIKRDGAECFVVRDKEALRQFSRDATNNILKHVLSEVKPGRAALALVDSGLELDPFDPYLNALRVYLSPKRTPETERLAKSCTRGNEAKAKFVEMLLALDSKESEHVLSYEKGITEGGGLNVDYAASILKSIHEAVRKLSKEIRDANPFLMPAPPPRLYQLQPSSAKLTFRTVAGERPVGERVGRFFELRALERALRGEASPELYRDPAFDAAITTIAKPSKETTVRQKPLDSDQSKPVTLDSHLSGDDISEDYLSLLAIVTGALSDAQKLEVRYFPGTRGRLLLSIEDDGEGKVPKGVEFVDKGSLRLNRLAVVDLRRESNEHGSEKYYLRGLAFVDNKRKGSINVVPSSIVRGAFRSLRSTPVTYLDGIIKIGTHEIDAELQPSKEAVSSWLRKFEELCLTIELEARGAWIAALTAPKPSTLAKILLSLEALGGETTADELAEEVSRRFQFILRVNNTRREVINNKKYLEFADKEEKIVRLSDLGRKYVTAYRQAGGDEGLPRQD